MDRPAQNLVSVEPLRRALIVGEMAGGVVDHRDHV